MTSNVFNGYELLVIQLILIVVIDCLMRCHKIIWDNVKKDVGVYHATEDSGLFLLDFLLCCYEKISVDPVWSVRDQTIAQFSNSNVATKCCHYPLKFFTCLHQPGGAGLRGSGNGSGNIWVRELCYNCTLKNGQWLFAT